jgi:hypothetical protein
VASSVSNLKDSSARSSTPGGGSLGLVPQGQINLGVGVAEIDKSNSIDSISKHFAGNERGVERHGGEARHS